MAKHTLNPRPGPPGLVPTRPAVDPPLPPRIYSTGLGVVIQTGTDTRRDNVSRVVSIVLADLLIPGDGDPLSNAAVDYTDAAQRVTSVRHLMPGLWDCHVHFGSLDPDYLAFLGEHPATAGARLARGCWEALQRGYTSLRDVAGLGCEVARAIEDGSIVGPHVYSAGACLSQLAGHGDAFGLPAGLVLSHLGVQNIASGSLGTGETCVVDGARCIKILGSGGVMTRDDGLHYAQFSPEELAVIVQEAARFGRAVAAHVHGKAGILAVVQAGVRTVEHVSFADEECIQLIKRQGVVYIATRTIIGLLLQSGGKGIPPPSWDKLQECAAHNLEAYRLAIRSGVTIALGTDTPPGFNAAMELDYAVQAGLSSLEAIKAATANGPLSVQGQVGKTGQLRAGYEADMIGVLANPVEDVRVLQKKDNIEWAWKGGKVFKGPGVGPWGEE